MKLRKTLSIIILLLFVFSSFVNIPLFDPFQNSPVEEEIVDNPPSPAKDLLVNNPSSHPSLLDTETWHLGESVNTTIEFNKQAFDIGSTIYENSGTEPDYWRAEGHSEVLIDDEVTFFYMPYYGTPTSQIHYRMYSQIYCGGAGSFNYEVYTFTKFGSSSYTSTEISGTLSVTSSMLDAQGYLSLFVVTLSSNIVANDDAKLDLYYYDSSGKHLIDSFSDSGSWFTSDLTYVMTHFDVLHFERSTIINIIRSEHRYPSPTQSIHSLEIPSVPHAKEINVNLREDETVTSVNPYADWSVSSNVLTITSPTELTYEVLSSSNCSNRLCIQDASTDYFENIGFETGTYQDDIVEQSGYEWDLIGISTSTVFEGYHSVELENTVASRSIISIDALEGRVRNFYFQISVCYETVTSGSLYIYYKDASGTWTSHAIDNTILNRWQTLQIFVADAEYDGTKGYFRIDTLSGTNFEGKVYIDNIGIFETSTIIITDEPSKSLITTELHAWDGRKNPLMPFETVEIEFIDRTDLKIEYLYYTTTNEYGIATWTLNSGLEQKEYVIKTRVSEQPAGLYFFDETVTDWGTNEIDGTLQGDASYSKDESHNCIYFDGNGDYVNIAEEVFLDGFETVSISIWFKTDNTDVRRRAIFETSGNYAFWFEMEVDHTLCGGALTDVASYSLDKSFTVNDDVWHHAVWTYTEEDLLKLYFDGEYIDEIAVSGNLVATDGFHIGTYRSANDRWFEGFIDEPRIYHKVLSESEIYELYQQFQQADYYFTPSYASHTDYAETEELDAWDFSEGDLDGTEASGGCADDGVENGYRWIIADSDYDALMVDGIDTDSGHYNTLIFKIWSNVSGSSCSPSKFYINYRDSDNINIGYQQYIELIADTWITHTFTISSAYVNNVAGFYIGFDAGWSDYPVLVKFDFIELVHIDSWLPQTNDYATDELLDAWDWEEGDDENDQYTSTYNPTYEDGYWVVDAIKPPGASSDYRQTALMFGDTGSDPEPNLDLDASYYNYLIIRFKTNVSISNYLIHYFFELYNGQGYKGFAVSFQPNGEWQHLTVDLSLNNDWTGTIQRFGFLVRDSDYGFFQIKVDYIYIIHQEEMTYTTIQNSVLLESETNDLLYDLYLDWNLIGTFSDLSLIPLIATVGTHYLQIQPYRTDSVYLTQNIYTYYYEIDPSAFAVSIESFYLSDSYVTTYVTANYDGTYIVYEDDVNIDSGTLYLEGTAISTSRDVTAGSTINYTIAFTYGSEVIVFQTYYTNPSTNFYVSECYIDMDTTITITWVTSKSSIDSLTVYEDAVLKVNSDATSPSSWTKSTVAGEHYVALIFSATDYDDIFYSFVYTVDPITAFSVNVESFYLSDSYINTYITASLDGNYYVYQDNNPDGSGSFYATGTTISSVRDTTAGSTIDYAIKFVNDTDVIWFNTTYSNPTSSFYIESCSIEESAGDYVVTWDTTKDSIDSLTVTEDGVLKVDSDPTSTSSWTKSTTAGTHYVILLFEATGFDNIILSYVYTVSEEDIFTVSVESWVLSDDNVSTYLTSTRNGTYYVYEDNVQIDTASFNGIGTTIETSRDTTEGVTIAYSIKFVNDSTIWFNATYSNPIPAFYLTDYRVDELSTITVTWATTLPALDSLTVYEDGVLKVNSDSASPSSWSRSTVVGNHYATLIFSATGYDDIVHSFSYTIYPVTAFSVYVHTFFPTDDYFNLYCTSNYDYTYESFTNGSLSGSGSGLLEGTFIIVPKTKEAGLFNLTIVFTYSAETVTFMTWYSNLIPPLHPLNDLYRTESDGYYNISLYTNLDSYWIDVYHDEVLVDDDSTATRFSILKDTLVGYHNITLLFIYNVSTDAEGYPVAEYNISTPYFFSYEVVFFYDVRIRYLPEGIGLAIGERFKVGWVKTYIDGELVLDGNINDVPEYSNYTLLGMYDIRIKNTMPIHNLLVTDLLDTEILNITINISEFVYKIVELPVFLLGVVNLDTVNHKFGVRPYYQFDSDYEITPIIAPGLSFEFWFHSGVYAFRIYNPSTYLNDNGFEVTTWNDFTYLSPGELPITIVIPLTLEGPAETTTTETNFTILGILTALALAVLLIRKRKLRCKKL